MENVNRWTLLVIATALGTVNQVQRYALAYIAANSSLLEDTDSDEIDYGIIMGPGTLATYIVCTLLAGRLLDKIAKPKWLILPCCLGVCVMTALNSLATSFWGLLYPRVGLAIFSSCIDPIILKLLVCSFNYHRGLASGCYFLSIYLGIAFSSLMIIVVNQVGWRNTFLIIGCTSGFLSFVLGFFLKNVKLEPKYIVRTSLKEDLPELFRNYTLMFTMAGLFFIYLAGFSRTFFEAMYFSEVFPENSTAYAVLNMTALLICPVGAIVGGRISDHFTGEKVKFKSLLISFSLWIIVPLLICMYMSSLFFVAMLFLQGIAIFSEVYISVSYSIIMSVATPRIRGLQTSCMIAVTFFAGMIPCILLGILDTNVDRLRMLLISFTTIGYSVGSVCFLAVSKFHRSDINKQENEANLLDSFGSAALD